MCVCGGGMERAGGQGGRHMEIREKERKREREKERKREGETVRQRGSEGLSAAESKGPGKINHPE